MRHIIISLVLLSVVIPSVWAKDPTQPPIQWQLKHGGSAKSQLTLSGIMQQKQHLLAIVNDQIVHQGDPIDGFKVVHIKPQRVILHGQNGGREVILTLNPTWKRTSS